MSTNQGEAPFALLMVKGMPYEELAVCLGAQPGTVMDPDTARETLRPSQAPGRSVLPDYAMVGETDDGWAFAIESPEAPNRSDRYAPGRDLWSKHSVVRVSDSTMDPPVINVSVDGKHDWMFWEHMTDDVEHPLTRSLVAAGGFVEDSDRVYIDDASRVTMLDVYRAVGEYYGLTLPRQAIADRRLPHAFTEPRVLGRVSKVDLDV
ncbi:hypothetical protein [Actinacidiphila glaucinigra]|uniref:hypothetical protein n=1 Tax=Actinacidiphila glaucinigra TaxID=235986 RepID=UPI00371EDAFF